MKLLRYALDPAACDGEAENAATKFVMLARKGGLGLADIAGAIALPAPPPPRPSTSSWRPTPKTEPSELLARMPWGKYEGQTLGHLARTEPGYLRWLLRQDFLKVWLRDAIEVALDYTYQWRD